MVPLRNDAILWVICNLSLRPRVLCHSSYEYLRAATRRCCAHKLIDVAKRTSTNCLHNHIALLAQSDVDEQ